MVVSLCHNQIYLIPPLPEALQYRYDHLSLAVYFLYSPIHYVGDE